MKPPVLWLVALACWCAPAFAAEDTLVVLSPHNESIRWEFEHGFAEWCATHIGKRIDIDWRVIGGSSESIRFVQSEFARKPDGIGIDIFFGGGQEPYYELSERGWAAPYRLPDEELSGLAPDVAGIELRAADYSWYGAAISSFGILENLRVQRLAGLRGITRWEQLADPALRNWVGAGDPRGSGTMLVMFESFLQARGWDTGWQMLSRIAGNTRRFDRISSTTAKDAAVGESAYALAIDFYAFNQIAAAGKTNLHFVLPSDFAAINPDGIAILRGAPHRQAAELFLRYVLSEEGQQLWLLPRGHPAGPTRYSIERMPVRPALYAKYRAVSNVEVSPFDLPSGFRYDARLAQQRRGVVSSLAGALFVDVHADLKRAWGAVIARGLKPAELADLGSVPLTEAEAAALSREGWRDPATRNSLKTEWQIWAEAKYRRISSAGPAEK